MSYSIHLEPGPPCDHCGRRGEAPDWCPDPTYNLTPIFDRALTGEDLPNPELNEAAVVIFGEKTDRPRGLRLLDGKKAGETKAWIERALGHLENPSLLDVFTALEPPNGWGTLDGAKKVFRRLSELCDAYPANIWRIR